MQPVSGADLGECICRKAWRSYLTRFELNEAQQCQLLNLPGNCFSRDEGTGACTRCLPGSGSMVHALINIGISRFLLAGSECAEAPINCKALDLDAQCVECSKKSV